jgi:hypothetical protein
LLLLLASFELHLLLLFIALLNLLLLGLLLQYLNLFEDLLFIVSGGLLLLLVVLLLRWAQRIGETLLKQANRCNFRCSFVGKVLLLDGLDEVLQSLLRINLSLVFLDSLLTQEGVGFAAIQLLSL